MLAGCSSSTLLSPRHRLRSEAAAQLQACHFQLPSMSTQRLDLPCSFPRKDSSRSNGSHSIPRSDSIPKEMVSPRRRDTRWKYNVASFRVVGKDGEVERFCSELGLSRPEDFAIPVAARESLRIRSGRPDTRWKYNVFLSFRGPDTRKGITSELCDRLERRGIKTFMDDPDLRVGDSISPSLVSAIEESRFAIVILSPNYASSPWCLDELLTIIRCTKEKGQQS